MSDRKPSKFEFILLRLWHAWLAGSFLVAYVTADEDTYAMHLFAGYAVLAAIAVRLLVGMLAPAGSPLRLPRPNLKATLDWLVVRKGRHPLFAWLAATLLFTVGAAAVTGALADGLTWLEDAHEAVSELSLWVVFAHVAFVAVIYGGRRLAGRVGNWIAGLRLPVTSKETLR